MVVYGSAYDYIISIDDLKARALKVGELIDAYTETLLKGATTGNMQEYSLDDGQSKIKTVYKSAEDLVNQIKALRVLQKMYIEDYNSQKYGRAVRMIDSKNFKSC